MDNPLAEFSHSLDLWLPDGEIDPSLLPSLHRCQLALDDMIRGRLNFRDYCDILESEGVEMDVYLDTAYQNTSMAGL